MLAVFIKNWERGSLRLLNTKENKSPGLGDANHCKVIIAKGACSEFWPQGPTNTNEIIEVNCKFHVVLAQVENKRVGCLLLLLEAHANF